MKLSYATLILFFSLFLLQCQPEEYVKEDRSDHPFSIKNMGKKEIQQNETLTDILGDLQNRLNKQDNNHSGRMVYSGENDFFIDTDYGAYITNEDDNYHSYTFPIIGKSEITGFSNLLITINEDDNYEAFIVQYDMNATDKEHMAQGFEIDLAGKVNYYPINDFDISTISNARKTRNCIWIITTGCTYGKHPTGYLDSGSKCGGHFSDIQVECIGGSGSSGGGSGISGGFSDDGSSGGSAGGGTGLPEDTEVSTPLSCSDCQTYEEAMAALWEEEVKLEDNFKNNDCVMDIWNTMKDLDVGYETLANFLKDDPKAELSFDIQQLPNVNGRNYQTISYNPTTGEISSASSTIILNSNKLNRSKLDIARTLLHEMIHAELFSMVVEAGGYDDLEAFAQNASEEDDPFKVIWEYYQEHGSYIADSNPGWQHEYMADNYIEYIAAGLKELHPILSSQGFSDYGNSISDVLGDTFSWNDMFYYMAWAGLQETEQFQTEIVDKGKNENYNFYLTLVKQESLNNKCN